MFDSFLRAVLRQRWLVLLGAAGLLVVGVLAWQNLPIDAFPDASNVQVMILTEAPGLTPGEMERLVSFPIETAMGGLPDVRQVRSMSKSGLSQVVVIFKDHVDTYFSRQVVFERLSQVRGELPAGIEPELGPVSTGLGEIYQYVIEAGYYCDSHSDSWSDSPGECPSCGTALVKADYDLAALRTMQDWLVSPQLRRLPGINEMNSFGGYVKQFHVVPDPSLLLQYDVSLSDVIDALESNGANAGGGFILRDWEQVNVVTKGLFTGEADIEQIVLKSEDGTPVYLGDLADVRPGRQTRNGAVTRDGKGEVVVGMTIMLRGSNSKHVVDGVRAAIPGVQKSLPAGVKISPFYDRSDLIEACVRTVSTALSYGIVLIVLILFIILWDIRAAVTVAVSLPITASIVFILMRWQGVTANLMSLGGLAIAIGMVVDGAIIVTENIVRHMHEETDSDLSRIEIAFRASREVARPVLFAIFIIVVVFFPLFTLEAMEGKMFKPLAITICFALVGSAIASLTIVPALASLIVKRVPFDSRNSRINNAVVKAYMPVLSVAMRGRWKTIGIAAFFMLVALAVLPRIGTEFLPSLDEGAIAINVVRLPSASVEGSVKQCSAIEKRLIERFSEIRTVVSKTGRAEIAEDPMGPEQSDIFIMLKPKKEWASKRTKAELVEAISDELAAFPGISPAFSQPIALRVNELVSGIKSDIAVKIFGPDMDVLQETAERISPVLSCVPGAEDVKIEQVSGFSQIEIQMDRQAMARAKINAEDVNLLVETAVGGKAVATVFQGQYRLAVLVRFPLEYRKDIDALKRLLVPSPLGHRIPLGDLAVITEVDVPAQISREDSIRRLIVECNVRGRDIGGFVQEARDKLADIENQLPEGYRFAWGGQFENQQRAAARLKLVVPVSLLLIMVMLACSLGSVKSALLVLVNLPFAIVGGILTIYLLGIHLSVSASVGFIVLLGVAVEDGLVLVSFFGQLRGKGMSVREAVTEACRLRVLPMITTSVTTLLGLLPMLLATGAGSELQRPLVAVVFGGLISSLALTLVILPVLYDIVESRSEGKR